MAKAPDLVGQRFGKLTVLMREGTAPNGAATWHLLCECGGRTTATTGHLRAGRRSSCRCGLSKPKHGMRWSRLYRIWTAMKARCQNPRKKAFRDYGGRGISVCEDWQMFIPFMEWSMANGYRDDLEIDRIDNDGPYTPLNCRWVTRAVNAQNKRKPRPLGLRYTTAEIEAACTAVGYDAKTLMAHLPAKRVYR